MVLCYRCSEFTTLWESHVDLFKFLFVGLAVVSHNQRHFYFDVEEAGTAPKILV